MPDVKELHDIIVRLIQYHDLKVMLENDSTNKNLRYDMKGRATELSYITKQFLSTKGG